MFIGIMLTGGDGEQATGRATAQTALSSTGGRCALIMKVYNEEWRSLMLFSCGDVERNPGPVVIELGSLGLPMIKETLRCKREGVVCMGIHELGQPTR